jgi:glycosyltransferase involved in cell wall biosynthesis
MNLDLTVVIATYDRPAGLAATLASCLAQTNALGLKAEILVLDNHPSQNGRAVVEALAPHPWPVRHLTELTRNMSLLRNRGFGEARAPLVAFIDDDEVAAPDWLDRLVGALREAGAAIAVGPRRAVFAAGAPPAYDPAGAQFVRDLGLPDGADVELTAPSGKPRYGLGTGNSLFHLERCFGDGEPAMRERFGDAGGEDSELFIRLHRKGRRIVWAAKAVVTETVTAHRTEIGYRLTRTLREAQHYVSIYRDGARRPRLTAIELWLKGVVQIVFGGLVTVATFEFASSRRLTGRLLIANGLGKLTWVRPVGYIQEPAASVQG